MINTSGDDDFVFGGDAGKTQCPLATEFPCNWKQRGAGSDRNSICNDVGIGRSAAPAEQDFGRKSVKLGLQFRSAALRVHEEIADRRTIVRR